MHLQFLLYKCATLPVFLHRPHRANLISSLANASHKTKLLSTATTAGWLSQHMISTYEKHKIRIPSNIFASVYSWTTLGSLSLFYLLDDHFCDISALCFLLFPASLEQVHTYRFTDWVMNNHKSYYIIIKQGQVCTPIKLHVTSLL